MSTSYEFYGRGKHDVTWKKLLSTPGVEEHNSAHSKRTMRCLCMDGAYLWAFGGRKYVNSFDRYGMNNVIEMLNVIAKHLKVKIRSEHGAIYPQSDEKIKQASRAIKKIHGEMQRLCAKSRKKKRKKKRKGK